PKRERRRHSRAGETAGGQRLQHPPFCSTGDIVISSHSNPLIVAQHLSDHTRVYTTAPQLVAPIAQIHCIFALPSVLPQIPGETPALLEWMQRGTESYNRSEIFDAFGAIGIEPQLSMLPGAVLFSMQCLDACREQALRYAQELL